MMPPQTEVRRLSVLIRRNIRRYFFLSYRQKISIPREKEILPEFLISPEPEGNLLP